ncbi:hypothetical protein HH304_19860 [Flammeovirgaceae bacterium KN852]|uniref:Outer membrane protein beta-barrel domain-containing protein n=2 Tax=Marinigracilibium pacificum TaxID=2729599 RepID=A0A848J4M8_9BACT|nr:hypothetical protein [Marinigracilibium pacificum]
MSYVLTAQESVKQKEIGLVFSNLDNFGFTYRTGTNKSLWRFNSLFISGINQKTSNDNNDDSNSRIGFGVSVGKEFRKNIVEKLDLRYGADLSFGYSKLKTEHHLYNNSTKMINYCTGINFIVGFNYLLGDDFLIGAEILPGVSYSKGKTENHNSDEPVSINKSSSFYYGISNSSVQFSLVYKW